MKILKLEWRNIFSYGDDITEIDFGDTAKLWQLTGESGSGKSSMLTVPKLLLFGKTEGSDGKPVNVSEIANWVNKKGWIRGTIQKGNDIFVIERTFVPQGLSVTKNGESLDKAGLKNMQTIIETEVLDNMPYHIFSNVMILSLNNFKSFVSMSPADKRQIIDKIFELEIINKVHELVKKDMRDLGNQINISNSQVYSLDQTIKTSTEQLDNVNLTAVEQANATMNETAIKMQKLTELYNQYKAIYDATMVRWTEAHNTENEILSEIRNLTNKLNNVTAKINLFNQDKCPTCGADFSSDDFAHIKNDLLSQQNEINQSIETYRTKHNEIDKVKSDVYAEVQLANENINKINAKYNELNVIYLTAKKQAEENTEVTAIQNIIDATNKSKNELEKSISEFNGRMKILDIMENMYSSEGIKQSMMSTYIPTLNKEIDDTLKFLGFPYTLSFDNNFDPHLQYLGRDIKPQSLSIGEHKKVDLTVLCSLLKMVKRKYPQLNLVCLDETVSSLDYVSSANVIRYLKEISSEMGLNIFIVSHTTLDENLFDEHLHVNKVNSYSILSKS